MARTTAEAAAAPQMDLEQGLAQDTPTRRVEIPEPGGMGDMDLMAGVAWGDGMDAVGSGIPPVGQDQPWREVGVLEANTPEARPGYVQRWVRIWRHDGTPDAMNVTRRMQQGWRPRSAETIPPGRIYATARDATHGTVIAVSGMVLMERSIELDGQYRKRLRMRTDRQSAGAIGDDDFDVDARYATLQGRAKTRVGAGREAASLIDD